MSLIDQLSHQRDFQALDDTIFAREAIAEANRTLTVYDAEALARIDHPSEKDIETATAADQLSWLHCAGLPQTSAFLAMLESHHIHPLIAEDILNTESRVKVEQLEDSLVIVMKLPVKGTAGSPLQTAHFCLILRARSVLTFAECELELLEEIHTRLDDPSRRIRRYGSDYLAWAILDLLVDYQLHFIDVLEDNVQAKEDDLMELKGKVELTEIHHLRNEVTAVRRLLSPLRDVTQRLVRTGSPQIGEQMNLFYADLHDHASVALESADHLRDHTNGLRELYFTATSHRMNEVMKVLTSLSAIFLPLTFLAGLYGMNFVNMPELQHPLGYPIFLSVLLILGGSLFVYFRRKGWL